MIIEILLIAVSVSMDAFAVAIGKGLTVSGRVRRLDAVKVGLWFGGFQALFPVLGFLAASTFSQYVTAVDHWIIFVLLLFIGGNMIYEAVFKDDEEDAEETPDFDWKHMLPLAVATSIDAFAVGVSFAFLPINVPLAIALIGVTTALFSIAGVYIGHFFGARWQKPAQITGGVVLVLIGVRVLLEHLGVIAF